MLKPKHIPLVLKQVVRHRTRSLLTAAGVACAMFLFCLIESMRRGAAEATEVAATDTNLIVYRADRYCPMTSNLPEHYRPRIEGIEGVTRAVPMRIVPTNCRTSLDVITFRGVHAEDFQGHLAAELEVLSGSVADWARRSDAALVGDSLARRRGFRPGDRFDAAGITVYVAGIFRAAQPQHENCAYVHLDFLQRNTGSRKLGVVTQFSVTVSDPKRLTAVGRAIDETLRYDQEPTSTYPQRAFVARAAMAAVEVIRFTRWLGYGCLAAVLALVGNAIVLSVQDRVRDHAVLQTLGYNTNLIARLIVAEGLVLAMAGGAAGTAAAWAAEHWGRFALSAEGQSIAMRMDWPVVLIGLAVSGALGLLAGLVPAWQASRREIAACFRAV